MPLPWGGAGLGWPGLFGVNTAGLSTGQRTDKRRARAVRRPRSVPRRASRGAGKRRSALAAHGASHALPVPMHARAGTRPTNERSTLLAASAFSRVPERRLQPKAPPAGRFPWRRGPQQQGTRRAAEWEGPAPRAGLPAARGPIKAPSHAPQAARRAAAALLRSPQDGSPSHSHGERPTRPRLFSSPAMDQRLDPSVAAYL